MTRRLSLALIALFVAGPVVAQVPSDLRMRIDHSTNPSDPDDVPDVSLAAVENGFQTTTGPAATMWAPGWTTNGNYTLSARFTLQAPASHRSYYGLIFGGRNLESENQRYLYFMVAQTGEFVVIHRVDNENTVYLQDHTSHPAVRTPGADGRSVNDLAVRVRDDRIEFVVNGTVVHTATKTGPLLETNGIYGVRINHVLPGVSVQNLMLSRMD